MSYNGTFVNKEYISKLHIKELWSCLSVMDANSNESLSMYSFLVMSDVKSYKYFAILHVGEPIWDIIGL